MEWTLLLGVDSPKVSKVSTSHCPYGQFEGHTVPRVSYASWLMIVWTTVTNPQGGKTVPWGLSLQDSFPSEISYSPAQIETCYPSLNFISPHFTSLVFLLVSQHLWTARLAQTGVSYKKDHFSDYSVL